jgi:hypothetical protein
VLANPGIGYRNANSVLCEISLHLLDVICNTNLTAGISTGVQIALVNSTVGLYIGALVVVDTGTSSQEIVFVTAVVPDVSFTATFANAHLTGASVLGGTFPSQQPTDPLFTQSEILGYLARAQNEYLARVPFTFDFFDQEAFLNLIFQATPANCIEISRIAYSSLSIGITSLTRTGNVVTAVAVSPTGFTDGTNGTVASEFTVFGTSSSPLTDPTFAGSFLVSQIVNPTTFKYAQGLGNSASTGGYIGLWTRLYEQSQEELTMANRNWQNANQLYPTSWFEDRAGNYRWGLGGKPTSNFPLELLCSIRDSDTLLLTDGFLVPDVFLHYVKYKALEYAWSKDGVQSNPAMAQYCQQRFEAGILATQRWIDGVMLNSRQPVARGRK